MSPAQEEKASRAAAGVYGSRDDAVLCRAQKTPRKSVRRTSRQVLPAVAKKKRMAPVAKSRGEQSPRASATADRLEAAVAAAFHSRTRRWNHVNATVHKPDSAKICDDHEVIARVPSRDGGKGGRSPRFSMEVMLTTTCSAAAWPQARGLIWWFAAVRIANAMSTGPVKVV